MGANLAAGQGPVREVKQGPLAADRLVDATRPHRSFGVFADAATMQKKVAFEQ